MDNIDPMDNIDLIDNIDPMDNIDEQQQQQRREIRRTLTDEEFVDPEFENHDVIVGRTDADREAQRRGDDAANVEFGRQTWKKMRTLISLMRANAYNVDAALNRFGLNLMTISDKNLDRLIAKCDAVDELYPREGHESPYTVSVKGEHAVRRRYDFARMTDDEALELHQAENGGGEDAHQAAIDAEVAEHLANARERLGRGEIDGREYDDEVREIRGDVNVVTYTRKCRGKDGVPRDVVVTGYRRRYPRRARAPARLPANE